MSSLTPEEIRIEYNKAMTEFEEAKRATLVQYPNDLAGMSAAHNATLRLEAATANRKIWAQRLASQ